MDKGKWVHTGSETKDARRAFEHARRNDGIATSFQDVSAALARERERSASLAHELEIMREYAPMDLHEYTSQRLIVESWKSKCVDLQALVYERDGEIKKLKAKLVGGPDAPLS